MTIHHLSTELESLSLSLSPPLSLCVFCAYQLLFVLALTVLVSLSSPPTPIVNSLPR